jgi:hypothetical protein
MWALEANADAPGPNGMDPGRPGKISRIRFGDSTTPGAGERDWHGTDARGVTRFVLAGRALLRERYRTLYETEGAALRERRFPAALPAMAQFRMTRRVCGQVTLNNAEHGKSRDDSIGLVADWRKPGHVWEIPYGTLVPQGVQGLLTAGRCISSAGDAWEVTRVIPAAALTGEAAGTAAALAVQTGAPPADVPAEKIQAELAQSGIVLHLDQVGA